MDVFNLGESVKRKTILFLDVVYDKLIKLVKKLLLYNH